MRRFRRSIAVAGAMVLGVAGLAGCVVDDGPPTTTCTDEVRTAGEPGDAEPLLVFDSAAASPTVLYADGAVAIPTSNGGGMAGALLGGALLGPVPAMAPGFYGDQPGGYVAGWLSDCELSAIEDAAAALFDGDVDFGSPMITDSGSTPVTYLPADGDVVQVVPYAFSRGNPDGHSELSRAQRQARIDLANLWNGVVDSATTGDDLEIDRITIALYGEVSDSDVDWPLPPVSQVVPDGCVVLDDPGQVADVLDVLADNGGSLMPDSSYTWISATATPPGLDACADW